MSASDETVSEFMSFTGSNDPTEAQHYLEMSGGNLQTAVSLYMEHSAGGDGGGGIAGAGSAAAPQGVRAPDQTRTMRLMEDHHHPSLLAGAGLMGPVGFNSLMDPTMQMMNAMMEEEMTSAFAPVALPTASAAVRSRGSSVGNEMDEQKDEEDEYQYDMEDGDDDDEVQIVQPTLSDMFAPPTHLIHRAGGFQGARTMAKDTKRWLLVNIQRDNEFSSHALNRDVWRDELIENLVREGFIFFQVMDSNAEGRTYVERYNVSDFPHIGIIDPRTGRLLWRREGWTQQNPMTADRFAELVMDFCSRNTFDRPPQAPKPPGAEGKRTPVPSSLGITPVTEMSEDEQMQAALRASMEDVTDHVGGEEVVQASEEVADAKFAASPSSGPTMLDSFLSLDLPEEPSSGPRLQFRTPDGKRCVRRFSGDDTVKSIYAYAARLVKDEGKDFELKAGFPPADLEKDMDKTIDECQLSGQAVTIHLKD